jgi:hypothetical protein
LLLVSRAAASAPSGKTLHTPERHCFGKPLSIGCNNVIKPISSIYFDTRI